MARPSIVNEWIDKANKDLSIAQEDIKKTERSEYVAFNYQQAVEKFLKAYIIANNLEFRKTHDLVAILKICAQKDKTFSQFKALVEDLNPLYIESRYPEFVGLITHERAKKALATTEEIARFVKSKLH